MGKAPPGPDARRRRTKRAAVPPALVWSLLVAFAVAAAAGVYLLWVYPAGKGPGAGREVELAFLGDESVQQVAATLAGAGLVSQPAMFVAYARALPGSFAVARGPHLLTDDLSPRELCDRLTRSPRVRRARVTFPEGYTRFDMAKRLHAQRIVSASEFLTATVDKALLAELRIDSESAEGFLFPATYELPMDSAPWDVVRRLHTEFLRRYAAIADGRAAGVLDLQASLGWGRKEIVTLASMVEKEAVVDDERATIAGVFLNRLRDPSFTPKLLQCDPTAAYGCLADGPSIPSCASFAGRVTHDLLQDASNRYNTYKHEGLPPTPIANPGAKSLAAVLAPTPSRYLYFVARGEGRHTFSETYAGHVAAIRGNASSPPR
jgi:UPF0755 protein